MEYKVEDTELTSIANAIRSACNLSDELEFPTDFIAKIATLDSAYIGKDTEPYLYRKSPTSIGANYNSAEIDKLIGGTVAWNQLVANSGSVSVTVPSGHKSFSNIGGTKAIAISNGSAISATGGTDNIVDLTALFGSAEIADYVYSLEQTTEGSGIAWLKSHGFLTKDYYAYNTGSLLSVKTSAHVMRDENDVVIGNYPIDPNLELRGISKLDSGSLYYDGDVYESSGAVTRKYGIVDLGTLTWGMVSSTSSYPNLFYSDGITSSIVQDATSRIITVCSKYESVPNDGNSGSISDPTRYMTTGKMRVRADGRMFVHDESYSDATTFKQHLQDDDVYLVYELETPTTETAQPYASPQVVNPLGTEEYVDTRDVPVPVGHETKYHYRREVV